MHQAPGTGNAPYSFKPLGERGVLVDFGNRIDSELNRRVHGMCRWIEQHPFPGFIETIPAYSSLAVFYDPVAVIAGGKGKSPFDVVCDSLRPADYQPASWKEGQLIRIPVLYDGPDLATVATDHGMSASELIGIHSASVYYAYMIGFLPGFAYLGEVDECIASPRRSSPRKSVPAGSVGIAGRQTGIYPMDSPGGWQLIGRTPLRMFDPLRKQPCLILAGDRVQFEAISQDQYIALHGH